MGLYSLCHFLQCWRFRSIAEKRAVHPLYATSRISPKQRFADTEFLVIDCEMNGLSAQSNQLLSVGWVTIKNRRIVNASRRYFLLHAESGTGDTSKIHGLIDSDVAGASSVASVLMLLIPAIANKVLVFHHAPLDIAFLQRASLYHFQCPFLFSYIDTMEIEKQRRDRQGQHFGLRLAQCRERYGLFSQNQHNALADAHATAELLLAQASYFSGNQLTLKRLGIQSTCCFLR